ncbi:MAG: NAD(P)/FAD-dependent oxidoreductase [Opitutaceae bacterium]
MPASSIVKHSSSARLPRVVVLGAGFAGLNFCKQFPDNVARITVVDRQNHHLFQPLLYQVATAGLAAPDIAQPIRTILRKKRHLDIRLAEVRSIDLAGKRVLLDNGALVYDYLVIALGGRTSYFGRDEWEAAAPGLKSLDDALAIRRRILLSFERAETETNEARRRELMTAVVIGAGPTGVELAGTFAELGRRVLRRDFDHIDPAQSRVILVEGAPRVLPLFPDELSASAQRQLEALGVEVRLGQMVKNLREGEVELPDETIRAGTIIWAAGVGAVPVTRSLDCETDRAGRLKVLPDLSLPGHPEAFAAGDLVVLQDAKGRVVPGVAPAAMQMGRHIAKTIRDELRSHAPAAGAGGTKKKARERKAFVYTDKGSLATIGRSSAVAQVGRLRFSGLVAWLAWLGVHLIFLIGLRNRISVFLSWMYSYLAYKPGARIITGLGSPPAGRPPP